MDILAKYMWRKLVLSIWCIEKTSVVWVLGQKLFSSCVLFTLDKYSIGSKGFFLWSTSEQFYTHTHVGLHPSYPFGLLLNITIMERFEWTVGHLNLKTPAECIKLNAISFVWKPKELRISISQPPLPQVFLWIADDNSSWENKWRYFLRETVTLLHPKTTHVLPWSYFWILWNYFIICQRPLSISWPWCCLCSDF